jgi:hypothetical protein
VVRELDEHLAPTVGDALATTEAGGKNYSHFGKIAQRQGLKLVYLLDSRRIFHGTSLAERECREG